MVNKITPATNDVVFKILFVRHPKLLKNFIATVLEINEKDIESLTVRNPELPPNYVDGKLARLDILLKIAGHTINIEMQFAKKEDYKERTLYYWTRMYSDELKKGKAYNEVDRCICINILNFNMFDCVTYHSVFSVRENHRNELLTDKMELHFFELPKVGKELDETDSMQLWLQLFKAKNREALDMLKNTNVSVIQEGVDVIYSLSEDEKVQEYIRQREIAEADYYSDIFNARAEGIEEGKAKGMADIIARIKKWRAEGKTQEEIDILLEKLSCQ